VNSQPSPEQPAPLLHTMDRSIENQSSFTSPAGRSKGGSQASQTSRLCTPLLLLLLLTVAREIQYQQVTGTMQYVVTQGQHKDILT
jgi:hypothetical protein